MKSTKAEVMKRVEEVFKLRLGGAEFADIREYAAAPEQAWGVSDTQLWRYISAADKLMKERFDAKADHLLARHLLQRRQLYAHAMGAGDFNTALRVLQDEAKLEGLYPPTKIAPTNPAGDKPYEGNLTDAERVAALAALYARVGAAGRGPLAGRQACADGSLLDRPGEHHGGRRHGPGPVAGEPPAGAPAADVAPLFSPGGEEPDGRGAGDAGRLA
jgi:hypothetical protein